MDDGRSSATGPSLAQTVFDSFPDPLVVLDHDFRVVVASRAFRTVFGVETAQSNGSNLFALLGGRWDFVELRELLLSVADGEVDAAHEAIERGPVDGHGVTLFSAKRISRPTEPGATILLTFTDISERRSIESERQALLDHAEELLRQQSIMIREMEHRVANSLQIIASILLLKAKSVSSEETRKELQEAHKRVLSIAEVQKHLHVAGGLDQIEVAPYLEKLCAGLARSMVKDEGTVVQVMADEGQVASAKAVSLGLIVTELVINAIKHAFPAERSDGLILVTYERHDQDWKLVVSDNGVGKSEATGATSSGLGLTIIESLARQLEAKVEVSSDETGLRVSLTHATFKSRMPRAS